MTRAIDVAEYILSKARRPISTWKLQKLVYYSQAWHLAWEDEPLFADRIEAWANGPVCPALYRAHKGSYNVTTVHGDASELNGHERESVDIVLDYYKKFNGQQLSDLTHSEEPWLRARADILPRVRSSAEITQESMAEYYGSLPD